YKDIMLLGKDGSWATVDLGLVHSSAAPSIAQLIVDRLVQPGDVEDKSVSPNFLVRNWPPAFTEWSTRSVRDMFFASPQFPRLLNQESIKDTIARGVENGMLAYVGKAADGSYAPFHWNASLPTHDIEISQDVFLIQREVAEAYTAAKRNALGTTDGGTTGGGGASPLPTGGGATTTGGGTPISDPGTGPAANIPRLVWSGDVPHQKWMNFYTKVLSKFAAGSGLRLTLRIEVAPPDGVSSQKVDETRTALRELGLDDSLDP
ncbi:MAG: AAA family ATPase, partial [Gemmatimonadota bacterium]|nr:AAA family ATPase [Gemmatimonadota bacterium]